MSFLRNCRPKRRSDAADHQHLAGNSYCSSSGGDGVGTVHVKRKRLSFPSSGWRCSDGDGYVCPNLTGRSGIDHGDSAYPNGRWVLPSQMLPVVMPQHSTVCAHHQQPVQHSTVSTHQQPMQVLLAEEEDPVFMSRDQIERCSPSRKDGIDAIRETRLRYSYCSFLQNLGLRLELPQTTIGTAMVLCHRFFVRRSHACHDRYFIATAALFLAAKSEETPRPLKNVLMASYEICLKQNVSLHPQLLSFDWLEQYRERIIEAEQMILTTLNFELNVQHPYTPLISVLKKLGLSQTALVNLAWSLISEGLRSSLWLQFKPQHIAAGAAFLAAKFLNFDLAFYPNVLQEFQTTPMILQDVVQQLMELLL